MEIYLLVFLSLCLPVAFWSGHRNKFMADYNISLKVSFRNSEV